jgi:hypothetical protein
MTLPELGTAVPVGARGWYIDTAHDPDDRPVMGYDPDIRSTTRKVSAVNGDRVLRIVVRAYEDFGLYWFVTFASIRAADGWWTTRCNSPTKISEARVVRSHGRGGSGIQ